MSRAFQRSILPSTQYGSIPNIDVLKSIEFPESGVTVDGLSTPSDLDRKPNSSSFFALYNGSSLIIEYIPTTFSNVSEWFMVNSINLSELTTHDCIHFKSDGSKFYIGCTSNGDIATYSVSSNWDISSSVTYLSTYNLGVSGLTSIKFSSDGSNLYALKGDNKTVYQYSVSSSWDVSASTYSGDSYTFSISGNARNIEFGDNGSKLYVSDTTGRIYHYNLSTQWDITTASYIEEFISQRSGIYGFKFNDDGSGVVVYMPDDVYEGALGYKELVEPWSLNGNLFGSKFSSIISDMVGTIYDSKFSDDGTKFYILTTAPTTSTKFMLYFELDTPFELRTMKYLNKVLLNTWDSNANYFSLSSSGHKFYIAASNTNIIRQFSLSADWDITSLSYDSVSITATTESIRGFHFSKDGTKLYVIGNANDCYVLEYTLSVPWDISTTNMDIDLPIKQINSVVNVTFSPSGDKLYVLEYFDGTVYEYPLSANFDITSAGSATTFDISTQTNNPNDIFFAPDGLDMYITEDNNIFQYSLSTPWDITSSLFALSENISGFSTVHFSSDGSKFFTSDYLNKQIRQYTLSTPWVINTISASSTVTVNKFPRSLTMSSDGKKIYTAEELSSSVSYYELNTAWDITSIASTAATQQRLGGLSIYGIEIGNNDNHLYLSQANTSQLQDYTFGSPYDMSTLRRNINNGFDGSPEWLTPSTFFISKDGTRLFVNSTSGSIARVHQYELSTKWDIDTAKYSNQYFLFSTIAPYANIGSISYSDYYKYLYITNSTHKVLMKLKWR